jgi:DNA polymerase III gamma/tau subunit
MLASDGAHPSSDGAPPCLTTAITDDPSVDAEIATVRHALDRSLDEKWDHFRTDFRELWGQFQTECIESSHKLVVAEKAAADGRYAVLKDAYDKVKAKCADVDRYNQLLQEKLDHVQAEMKSLSAVSMTIQWEKRVASKQAECERLTKQLETQKQVNTTLKRENTLLNTQLEQWSDAREAEAAAKAKDATEAEAAMAADKAMDATEAAATAAAKAMDATEAATMAAAKAMDATEAAATAEATNNTDASSTSPAATEAPKAETEAAATSLVVVEASNPVTKPPTVALEAEQAAVASEPTPTAETAAPEDDAAVTSSTAPEPMTSTEPVEAVAPEPAPPATPTTTPVDPPAPPAITYTLKKLKRKKADTEKTPFLLGSDDVLYAWTEGDVPGAAVGTKTARGYKFTKK